ncbi:hypothetical protein HYH03_008480 [Edaphochlamys debaryana]|uniref:Uncharacterized protein n=1 Tax=Edaphochlamys debaryana TaxID=47281 RepID=A0A836BYW2_9CHLO|nr:hypothetical protein HYH03_008480 [Edaphochlamys debaryana]|eukprot:KAG2493347.1 hypothetical protein HYH03_008480 [Edaphochlamys debaryana]
MLPCAARPPCPPPARLPPRAPAPSRHSGGPQQLLRTFAAASCSGGAGSNAHEAAGAEASSEGDGAARQGGAESSSPDLSELSRLELLVQAYERERPLTLADVEDFLTERVYVRLGESWWNPNPRLERVATQVARELAPRYLEPARLRQTQRLEVFREALSAERRWNEAEAAAKAADERAEAAWATARASAAEAKGAEGEGLQTAPAEGDSGAGAGAPTVKDDPEAAARRAERMEAAVQNLEKVPAEYGRVKQAWHWALKMSKEFSAAVKAMGAHYDSSTALEKAEADEAERRVREALAVEAAARRERLGLRRRERRARRAARREGAARAGVTGALLQPRAPPSRHSGGPQPLLRRPFIAASCSGGAGRQQVEPSETEEEEAESGYTIAIEEMLWMNNFLSENLKAEYLEEFMVRFVRKRLKPAAGDRDLIKRAAEQAARELAPALLERVRPASAQQAALLRESLSAVSSIEEVFAEAKAAAESAKAAAAPALEFRAAWGREEATLRAQREGGASAAAAAGAPTADVYWRTALIVLFERGLKALRAAKRAGEMTETANKLANRADQVFEEARPVFARAIEGGAALDQLLRSAVDEAESKVRAALGGDAGAATTGETEAEERGAGGVS